MGSVLRLCLVVGLVVFGIKGLPVGNSKDGSNSNTTELLITEESSLSESTFNDSDMYLEQDQETKSTHNLHQTEKIFTPSEQEGGSQNFYPSFSLYNNQPLGHSRPLAYQQEAAYSQRPAAYRQQQLNYDNSKYNNPFRRENYQVAADSSQSLLGSGNFGVIRGGTFYNENEAENNEYSTGRYNNYSPYFHNNGHGRPSFHFGATNPKPQQHEQFANFRDFADINAPNPAYSQYVVVYVNKNGSSVHQAAEKKIIAAPKNIIERLAMIDLEVNTKKPAKKISNSKRKLALLPREKKMKNKNLAVKTTSTTLSPSDLYEPLLALS